MKFDINDYSQKQSLKGLSIVLSGSIPERDAWATEITDFEILEFVSSFSALVFKKGGKIIHGAHPSFTPILVNECEKFANSHKQLSIVASEFFNLDWLKPFEGKCEIVKLPSLQMRALPSEKDIIRNTNLTELRHYLLKDCNCLVSVGGKLHERSKIKSGVLEEVQLASNNQIVSYNLSSFGGKADHMARNSFYNPMISKKQQQILDSISEVTFLPSVIISILEKHAFVLRNYKKSKIFTNTLFRLIYGLRSKDKINK